MPQQPPLLLGALLAMLVLDASSSKKTGDGGGGYSSDPNIDCSSSTLQVKDGILRAAKEALATKSGGPGGAPWPSADGRVARQKDSRNAAFFVEFRDDPAIVPALIHYLDRLPAKDWSVVVWHGNTNRQTLDAFVLGHAEGNRVLLVNLDSHGVGEAIGEKDLSEGRGYYNCVLTSSALWDSFPFFEWILVAQGDTRLCSGSDHDLEYFTKLQYHFYGGLGGKEEPEFRNGGLSLRRRKTMASVCNRNKLHGSGAEDVFFGTRMFSHDNSVLRRKSEHHSLQLAPLTVSRQFSYSADRNGTQYRAFGIHQPSWSHILAWPRITSFCPEVNEIMPRIMYRAAAGPVLKVAAKYGVSFRRILVVLAVLGAMVTYTSASANRVRGSKWESKT